MTQDDIIEDLREQVAYWKSEALGVRDASRHATFKQAFGLDNVATALLDALYARRGGLLTKPHAIEALPENDDRDDNRELQVYICRLRKHLGADGIRTIWGKGWHLSDEALKTLDRITGINS